MVFVLELHRSHVLIAKGLTLVDTVAVDSELTEVLGRAAGFSEETQLNEASVGGVGATGGNGGNAEGEGESGDGGEKHFEGGMGGWRLELEVGVGFEFGVFVCVRGLVGIRIL